MDEDDDYFDMRGRIGVPIKKKHRDLEEKNEIDDSTSDSSASSEDDDDDDLIEVNAPRTQKPPPIVRNKKRNFISLDSDDDTDAQVASPQKRAKPLTPPPQIGEEALQKALKVIRQNNDAPRRSQNGNQPDKDGGGGFDLNDYLSSMNSGISSQLLTAPPRRESRAEETFLILLVGQKVAGEENEELPPDWTTSIVAKISAATTFGRLREQFLEKKRYTGGIVLAWKGTRLLHGCASDVGLKAQDYIDVFTIKGWEKHEEERRKVAEREDRKTELSDEPEEETVLPRTVLIFLRGPSVKLQLKTATIDKLINVYRAKCAVAPEKGVLIKFEGDVLDGAETVKGLELDDGDILDVEIV